MILKGAASDFPAQIQLDAIGKRDDALKSVNRKKSPKARDRFLIRVVFKVGCLNTV